MFERPVGLFIFNRPDTTERVLARLRTIEPTTLFVVADGPREQQPGDREQCDAARALIDHIDWPCTIVRKFSPVNLGVGMCVSSGISWIFEQVDEAIFLEDDCLPDPTFFEYCARLLTEYRDIERVMMICGTNPLDQWHEGEQSYHFSLYGQHWGWATWKRAWQHYEYRMTATALAHPQLASRLLHVMGDAEAVSYQLRLYEQVARGQIDAWDCQWTLGQLLQGGLAAVPALNLVSNIGFGRHATHTRQAMALAAHLQHHAMTFPLRAPSSISADSAYDQHYMAWRMGRPDLHIVITVVERYLADHHNAQALLLLEAALQKGLCRTGEDRGRINTLKARAIMALDRGHHILCAGETIKETPDVAHDV